MLTVMLPRANRVALGIPILYHRPGDDQWFHAKVVNLSESGVLFRPSELEPGTPVEIIFSPPMQVGALAPGKQVCVAEVVRITEAQAVAARFDECRFLLEAQ
jgi:PilZ domain